MPFQPIAHQAQVIGVFAFESSSVDFAHMAHLDIRAATGYARSAQRGGNILVHRPFKANIRAIGKHLQLAKTGLLTPLVNQGKIQRLVEVQSFGLPHLFRILRQQIVIGVQPENPVASCQFE